MLFFYYQKNGWQWFKIINEKNEKCVVALHYASFLLYADIIKYLNGANIKALTTNDLNVIYYGDKGNQLNSWMYFYLFYREKIKKEKTDIKSSTPIHWASYLSVFEIALYLLTYGDNINSQDKCGNTPLHLATLKNCFKIVKRLLQKSAVITIGNKENYTPIDIALKSNSTNIIELFKESEKCHLVSKILLLLLFFRYYLDLFFFVFFFLT